MTHWQAEKNQQPQREFEMRCGRTVGCGGSRSRDGTDPRIVRCTGRFERSQNEIKSFQNGWVGIAKKHSTQIYMPCTWKNTGSQIQRTIPTRYQEHRTVLTRGNRWSVDGKCHSLHVPKCSLWLRCFMNRHSGHFGNLVQSYAVFGCR